MKKLRITSKFGVQALACFSIVLLAATGYGAGIEIPANVVTRLGDVETLADANTAANTTEVARATAAEAANTSATTTEVARATAAEEANTASITTEVARATAAEEANTASITTEVARAEAAEAVLEGKVGTVASQIDLAGADLSVTNGQEITISSTVMRLDASGAVEVTSTNTLADPGVIGRWAVLYNAGTSNSVSIEKTGNYAGTAITLATGASAEIFSVATNKWTGK